MELPGRAFHLGAQFHPEFKSRPNRAHPLFKGFIATMRERGVLSLDGNAKLSFGDDLVAMAEDSKLILSRELRHSILKLAGSKDRTEITPPPQSA